MLSGEVKEPDLTTNDLQSDLGRFARIATGDEAAFAEIFHSYNAKIFPVAMRLVKSQGEAEEIVQEVFLRLWLHREKLPEIKNPGAWLISIASNLALTHLRHKAVQQRHHPRIQEEGEGSDLLVEETLQAREVGRWIHEAVELLPPSRREVFLLSRNQGYSRREIAEKLGISESTVKNQLNAALHFLQDYLLNNKGLSLPTLLLILLY